jgi:hypothetical protein
MQNLFDAPAGEISRAVTADPINPVAPVTITRKQSPPFLGVTSLEHENQDAPERLSQGARATVALMVSLIHSSRSAGRRGCWSGWACGCAEDGNSRSLLAAAICRSPTASARDY